MKKYNMDTKRRAAAGVLGMMMILGGQSALAAEGGAAVSIDAAQAEEIAFADADITSDMAERLHTKAEWEDGEPVYEVSFFADGVEYEYLIREADGVILEWELNGRDLGEATAEVSLEIEEDDEDAVIGMERAKEIALTDAGVESAEASFSQIKFERDSRQVVYEIEFYYARQELDYKIDAYSGEIHEMERD